MVQISILENWPVVAKKNISSTSNFHILTSFFNIEIAVAHEFLLIENFTLFGVHVMFLLLGKGQVQ